MLSTLRKKTKSPPRSRRPMASGGSQSPKKVPPLNLENVMTVVTRLPDINRPGTDPTQHLLASKDIRRELGIPKEQCMLHECISSLDRIRAGITWWLENHPQASWRKLICAIDALGQRELADEIRGYAEPLKDSSLLTDNITDVIIMMKNPVSEMNIGVPGAVVEQIKTTCHSHKAQCRALGVYWRDTVPDASWEILAHALYRMKEHKALEKVKKYLLNFKDSSLSKQKVMDIVMGVKYGPLTHILGTPETKRHQIVLRYSKSHRVEAAVQEYLTSHPCPSWSHLTSRLQIWHMEQGDIVPAAVVEAAAKHVEDSAFARSIVEAAMREGYTPRRDSTFLIVGPGGSGKTTLLCRLVDEDLDEVRRSTKLGMHPIRTISLLRFSVKGKVWKRVNLDDLSEMIADASLNPSLHKAEVGTQENSSEPSLHSFESAPQPKATPLSPQQLSPTSPQPSSSPQPNNHWPASAPTEPSTSHAPHIEDICRQVQKLRGYRNLLPTDWIHLVDSGGQPQFHEVMGIFYRRLSGYISVFKLSELLSHHNKVMFFEDGKPTNKPYSSAYSNEHIIRCNIQTVESRASKHKEGGMTKLAFVATHRDEDCSAEPLDEKNKKIHRIIMDLLPENMREGVISCGGSLKESIFDVNVLNPDVKDQGKLGQLYEALSKDPVAKEENLPLSFYGLEIALLKLMEKLERQVLSRQECLQVAIGLHFNEESFEVAMKFLCSLNIIHYDRDVLPNVVFGSSQVILDKITEVVVHSLQLREDPDMKCKATDGKRRRFRDQGILTIEILQEFKTHYISDLFTPPDVLKLLQKLLVVSSIGENEYFMPSLLVPSSEMAQSNGRSSFISRLSN